MPEYRTPGVYITETNAFPNSIAGVSTRVAGFVGMTVTDPGQPPSLLESWQAFERDHGGLAPIAVTGGTIPNLTALAVKAFFDQGGAQAYVARAANASLPAYAAALDILRDIADISQIAAPDVAQFDPAFVTEIHRMLIADAERAGRFAVLDTPVGSDMAQARATRAAIESDHAALYTPWLRIPDPDDPSKTVDMPPSGAVCGIYARTDTQNGVYKAPANQAITDAAPVRPIGDAEQDILNPEGINAIRFFTGRGTLIWGARTLSRDPQWRYVNVRRYLTYLERSISGGIAAAAFEPNDARLWAMVKALIENFLTREWQIGGLTGNKPEAAFFVRCDASTMTADDIAEGRVIAEVGVTVVHPAEFIVMRIVGRSG